MSTDTTDRLSQISGELATILEARIQELMTAMKAAEVATREVVTTGGEIARYRQLEASLTGELTQLREEIAGVQKQADEVRQRHAGLVAERDRLRDEAARHEREVQEADAQIVEQRARLRTLEEEGEAIRRENTDLKGKIRTLEENVVRMRALREELMMSISGLSHQMASLNLGSKE